MLEIRRAANPAELATLVVEQALDNALAAAQLLDDPREMIARSYQLLERVSKS